MRKLTLRNNRYLEFVRSLPCCITGDEWNIHAHHWRKGSGGGIGLKPSDYRSIPLSWVKHDELHNMGEVSFMEKHGFDPYSEMAANLESYLLRLLHDFDSQDRITVLEKLIELAEEEASLL